jgi:hypothetical protein
MKDSRFAFGENIVPLKAPVDSGGTAYATPWVDLKNALHATFFYYAGVVTATSADQAVVITMEAATAAASGSEVAIAFKYRLSGATGANTWGDITAATSTGYSFATDADGKMLLIDVDPAALDSALADARFVRMVVGIDAGGTVTLNSAWAVLDPRYPQLTHLSAT